MNIIADTELILSNENKIYHLNLSKDEIAETILLVGDPQRVELVSNKFDRIEYKIQHREFITHTGLVNKKKISVISTGIGPDNIDIVINELDALFNIDFNTRTKNKQTKSVNIIRLGTCGALQKNINVDTLIASSYALGLDNIAHFYDNQNVINKNISEAFSNHMNWPKKLSKPYVIKASQNLLNLFQDLNTGITATAPGFYGPQGRELRMSPSIDRLEEKMQNFKFKDLQIKNFEMETSALYYLGRTLGHNTLTICAVIGNRLSKKYSEKFNITVNQMIDLVLKKISSSN
jgi:uridine phosphorylase